MPGLRALGRLGYDLLVGDDWRLTVGAVGVLAVGAGCVAAGADGRVLAPLLGLLVGLVFALVVLRDAGRLPPVRRRRLPR